jgi:hypothetical protein
MFPTLRLRHSRLLSGEHLMSGFGANQKSWVGHMGALSTNAHLFCDRALLARAGTSSRLRLRRAGPTRAAPTLGAAPRTNFVCQATSLAHAPSAPA